MRFTPGSRDVDHEVPVLESLIVEEERPHVIAFVRDLQQASAPADFYRLQRRLLQRTYARQVVTDELRAEISETKDELRELTRQRPLPRNEVRTVQQRLNDQELALRCCKAVAHALRCVGDGIAWKTLRYDRGVISVLGAGRRVGRLAAGKGLDAELQTIAEQWWANGEFAIHNDLTNCLRTGDLTFPFGEAGIAVREVKAGSSRRTRQTKEAEERIAFSRRGRGDGVLGEAPAQLVRYPVRLRTFLGVLRKLVREARANGYASAQPTPSLVVTAVDPRVSEGEPGIDVMTNQARVRAGWDDDDRTVTTLTVVRRIRERMHHFAYLAPLTIYPLTPRDVGELLLGPLEFVTTLHAPTLESEFADRGIDAQMITEPPEASRVFLRAARVTAEVELPSLVCEQLLAELMDPTCLVAAVEYMLDSIDAGTPLGPTLVCLSDERDVWEGSA